MNRKKETEQSKIIVRETRERLGLTQKAFADLIGVARYSIADYETGRSCPPGDIMIRIIQANQR